MRNIHLLKMSWLASMVVMAVAVSMAYGQEVRAQQATTIRQFGPQEAAPVKVPKFEVMSVKPNKSGINMFRMQYTPDGVVAEHVPLVMLIRAAYSLMNSNNDQIEGLPDWAKTERFDIAAKVSGEDVETLKKLKGEQRGLMMRQLLEERFDLAAKPVTREGNVYALLVAKGGPKLKESDTASVGPDGKPRGAHMMMRPNKLEAQGVDMAGLAQQLTQQTGRTVLDKTELKGRYDLTLEWAPEQSAAMLKGPDALPAEETNGPSIYTALQEQLGLRLEPQKGPVQGLVIERVERPIEN